ncbi:BsuPI-related putative proteinase inhibitor [Pseudoneobacillus sp. C159]
MKGTKIFGGLLATLLITGLVGCGSTESDVGVKEPKKVVSGSNGDAPKGIVAGQLTPDLQKQIKDGKLVYIFSFKNDKETEEVLQYSSTQQYEYQIKDSKGTVVYTYSMDKMFLQTVSEQTIKQGEKVEFEIDLSEDLKKLAPDTYKFEVWSVAKDRTDLRAEAEFNWGGEGEGLEEDASKLAGAIVTYVGLMDQNSIEVINENGEYDHYRLSEKVKTEFATLEAHTKITIHYGMTSDGQKIIEEVIKE